MLHFSVGHKEQTWALPDWILFRFNSIFPIPISNPNPNAVSNWRLFLLQIWDTAGQERHEIPAHLRDSEVDCFAQNRVVEVIIFMTKYVWVWSCGIVQGYCMMSWSVYPILVGQTFVLGCGVGSKTIFKSPHASRNTTVYEGYHVMLQHQRRNIFRARGAMESSNQDLLF